MLAHISLKDFTACPADKKNIKTNMSKEEGSNVTHDGKSKYSEKNLSQSHLVQSKFHKDWRGIETEPSRTQQSFEQEN